MPVKSTANDLIVSSEHTVCLVGGARVDADLISLMLPMVARFIAVDRGADTLIAAGITPAAVIGDLDSISDDARAALGAVLHHIPEQDTTDFEKALSRVAAPMVVALGFTGGRMDHTLAVLNVLARFADRAVILADGTDVCFLAKQGTTLVTAPPGTRMSLMPLAECRVSVTGLRWSFTDRVMHPVGFISSSNEVAGDVRVQTDGPVLITLPLAFLPNAIKSALRGP